MALNAVPAPRACRCRPAPDEIPVALLTLEVDDTSVQPHLASFSVGYERQAWRAGALAEHLLDWVLDFALRPDERGPLPLGRARQLMKRAIRATFGNGNDRGVPGELLLHAICRQFYGSDTVINKVWFKTADNDTYKGFDGVHCVHNDADELELWLGEAKFYKNITKAIEAVLNDLREHFATDYLRTEFALISDKISPSHPHADALLDLLHPTTSLDEVFARIVVPVLVTYDSDAVVRHDRDCDSYRDDLETEARRAWMKMANGLDVDLPVQVKLLLVPLGTKQDLLDALDAELQA